MTIDEHYKAAEKAAYRAEHLLQEGPVEREQAKVWAQIAQVHATLATVIP